MENKTTLVVLKDIRELLGDKSKWTQGTAARDFTGAAVDPHHPSACSWCLLGATEKLGRGRYMPVVSRLHRASGSIRVSYINDVEGHTAVMDLLDKVIKSEGT
jgi:hypothetical protein